jgi:hypothetical protein
VPDALSQTGTPTGIFTPTDNLSLGPKKSTASKGATAIDPITPTNLKKKERKTELQKLLDDQKDFSKSEKRIAERKLREKKQAEERLKQQQQWRLKQAIPRPSLGTKEVQKASRPAPPLVKPPAAQTKRPPVSKPAVVPKR